VVEAEDEDDVGDAAVDMTADDIAALNPEEPELPGVTAAESDVELVATGPVGMILDVNGPDAEEGVEEEEEGEAGEPLELVVRRVGVGKGEDTILPVDALVDAA
jgi:hypothetical protein